MESREGPVYQLPEGPVYSTGEDYDKQFDTEGYLYDFYSNVNSEPAMKVILALLPSLAYRLQLQSDAKVLDIGSGPTIHVALCFRDKADAVYLSDYCEQNREELRNWLNNDSSFNWTNVAGFLAIQEGSSGNSKLGKLMEEQARPKVKGILYCDIHAPEIIDRPELAPFDVITSFFCIEYACETHEQYFNAVANICAMLRPGGFLIIGGILQETWCRIKGKIFACLYITEQDVVRALANGDMDTDNLSFYNHEGIFMLLAKKLERPKSTDDIQN